MPVAAPPAPEALALLAQPPVPPSALPRRLAAGGVGALVLVGGGTGANAVDAQAGGLGAGGVVAAFALSAGVMVLTVGHLRGAHLNPAVALAFAAAPPSGAAADEGLRGAPRPVPGAVPGAEEPSA